MSIKMNLVVPAALVAASVVMPLGVAMASTSTSANSAICAKADATNPFTVANGEVTAHFNVTGDDCKVSLASWQTTSVKDPAADKTYQSAFYQNQSLLDSKTDSFKVGEHTMTVKLPNCFYQVDLVRGDATGTFPDKTTGGPVYAAGTQMKSLHGGTQACEGGQGGGEPTPVVTPAVLPQTGAADAAPIALSALGGISYLGLRLRNKR